MKRQRESSRGAAVKRRIAFLAALTVALTLLITACETSQYDDYTQSCSTANGVYRIEIQVAYDRDQEHGQTPIPSNFTEACTLIGSAQR